MSFIVAYIRMMLVIDALYNKDVEYTKTLWELRSRQNQRKANCIYPLAYNRIDSIFMFFVYKKIKGYVLIFPKKTVILKDVLKTTIAWQNRITNVLLGNWGLV